MKHTFLLLVVLPMFVFFTNNTTQAQIITTIAGGGTSGLGDGGPAIDAELYYPIALAIDAFGNRYITDRGYNRIRKVDTAGIITTYAGTGVGGFSGDNGPATNANIHSPFGIVVDKNNNVIFVDAQNNRVRKVTTDGFITTIAGTGVGWYNGDNIPATTAELNYPTGLAIDYKGNIYIGDVYNARIRKIDTFGMITTFAGSGVPGNSGDNGQATAAKIDEPDGIVTDLNNNIYFTEYGKHVVKKIDSIGIINTIAGTGVGGYNGDSILATNAELFFPAGISIDSRNNLYVCDGSNGRVRKISVKDSSSIISTIAGTGLVPFNGDGIQATLANIGGPAGVTIDYNGNMYILDIANDRIRFIKNTVGISNLQKNIDFINVYPNPSNGNFTIKTNLNEKLKIIITNILGQTIKEFETIEPNIISINLNVPSGIYFIQIIRCNELMRKRITIY